MSNSCGLSTSPESLGIVTATIQILSLIINEMLCAKTDEKVPNNPYSYP